MNIELLLELLALAERFLGRHRHAAALAPSPELAGASPLVIGLLERFGLPLAAASLPLLKAAVEQTHWSPLAKQLFAALIDAAAKALPAADEGRLGPRQRRAWCAGASARRRATRRRRGAGP